MKQSLFSKFFFVAIFAALLAAGIAFASTGTIDPNNAGDYKAAFLDNSVVSNTGINFGKFGTESQYNITVSDSALRGYAWGSSVGWMVMNCADTTSGCSTTNGNFAVANNGSGGLSGYAWGENTGWINFGPFSDSSISTVQINATNGNFGGTQGSAGYAWSQNYGWIVFDCSNASTCVNTSWRPAGNQGGGLSGGGGGGSGTGSGQGGTGPQVITVTQSSLLCLQGTYFTLTNYSDGSSQLASTHTPCNDQTPPSGLPTLECQRKGSGPSTKPEYYLVYPDGTATPTGISCGSVVVSGSTGSGGIGTGDTGTGNGNGSGTGSGVGSTGDTGTGIGDGSPSGGPTTGDGGTGVPGPSGSPSESDTSPSGSPDESIFGSSFSLPPALVESFNSITGTIGNGAAVIVNAARAVKELATKPTGKTVTTVISAAGAAGTLGVAVGAVANSLALPDILLLVIRLWDAILIAVGIRKRRRPWGTVYDSVTKQPIDPAYVTLTDMQGNEVATSITDIDGRYGFAVAAGTYRIAASKTNYEFPSKKLTGKTADELYGDLYFGDMIVINAEGEVITKNIPLDQQNFDWNEFAKNEQKRLSYYHHNDLVVARISSFFYWFGFAVSTVALLSAYSAYNSIIFVLYLVMFLVRRYSPQFHPKGSIHEAMTGNPLPFAILHVMSAATGQEISHKVADRLGNYYCLVPNGDYSIAIERKNADATYTKTTIPQTVAVRKGYLKQNFEI